MRTEKKSSFYRHVPDLRFGQIVLDAMVLDVEDGPDGRALGKLLDLNEKGEVSILLPYSVKVELENEHTPQSVKGRSRDLIFTQIVNLTPNEIGMCDQIYSIVNGNARVGKHRSDSIHLFEALKYGRFFVTNDKRILRKRSELSSIMGGSLYILDLADLSLCLERML